MSGGHAEGSRPGSDRRFIEIPRRMHPHHLRIAAEDGRREKLTGLERKHAYGFIIERDKSDQSYWMTLVSQKRRPIHIYKDGDKVRAVTLIAEHQAFLRKIYVKTRKVGLLRTAEYFELFGSDVATGEDCYEKVAPRS